MPQYFNPTPLTGAFLDHGKHKSKTPIAMTKPHLAAFHDQIMHARSQKLRFETEKGQLGVVIVSSIALPSYHFPCLIAHLLVSLGTERRVSFRRVSRISGIRRQLCNVVSNGTNYSEWEIGLTSCSQDLAIGAQAAV